MVSTRAVARAPIQLVKVKPDELVAIQVIVMIVPRAARGDGADAKKATAPLLPL